MLSYFSARYDRTTVLISWSFAIGMVLSLTAYSFCIKTEFSSLCAMGFVIIFSMFFLGLFAGILRNYYYNLIYCALGAILYGLFLVCDTKLIIGDNSNQYNVDDYILASLSLYFDIIMIFLYALSAVGGRN